MTALQAPGNSPADELLSASREILLLVDRESLTVRAANPYAARVLGLTPDELIGRDITELECSLQDVFYWNSVGLGQVEEIENVDGLYARADGEALPVRKSISRAVVDGRDHLIIRARDQRPAQAVEQELERTTSLLRATLESTAEGILVIDLSGRIVNFNHRFAELWGLHSASLERGRDRAIFRHALRQLTHPSAGMRRLRELLAARDDESFDTFELKDGRAVECRSRPQTLASEVLGRVFSFNDVSKRIRQARELAAARDAALAASRAKTDFLSQMSHELRTPLNAILGFSELLADEVSDASREPVEAIRKAGRHLLDLINDLLDMARIEAGKIELCIEAVDLAALAGECIELLRPLAERHGVNLAPAPGGEPAWVQADRLRLKQMLINLISNGIKYNRPQGRVWIEIERGRRIRACVCDTGVGITEADQAALFQTFSRVGEHRRKIEGTGIGLAFTRKLARLMSGEVGMLSHAGEGSRFWIELPADAAAAPAPKAESKVQASAPLCPPGTRLLYIEDDRFSRLLIERLFARFPEADLKTAENGAEGLRRAREHRPALILCDMNLGDMVGSEILAALRADPETAAIPVLALSANAMPEEIEAAMAAGFDGYLTKPVQASAVVEAVRQTLAHVKAI